MLVLILELYPSLGPDYEMDKSTARINVPAAETPSIEVIQQFCSGFDPVKARLAPERGTVYAHLSYL